MSLNVIPTVIARPEGGQKLAEAKRKIAELEGPNVLLTASHQAMIRALGELGGMCAWCRFFDDYQATMERLEAIGAMSASAKVIALDRGD